MKSGICIILGGVILCLNLHAQFKDQNLSDYKLPDLKRHQLDLNFYLYNYYQFGGNNIIDTVGNRKEQNFSFDIGPSYSF